MDDAFEWFIEFRKGKWSEFAQPLTKDEFFSLDGRSTILDAGCYEIYVYALANGFRDFEFYVHVQMVDGEHLTFDRHVLVPDFPDLVQLLTQLKASSMPTIPSPHSDED